MTHVPSRTPRRWVDDWQHQRHPKYPETISVEQTDPTIRKLYGPNGEVLRTFSDRPTTGFAGREHEHRNPT